MHNFRLEDLNQALTDYITYYKFLRHNTEYVTAFYKEENLNVTDIKEIIFKSIKAYRLRYHGEREAIRVKSV